MYAGCSNFGEFRSRTKRVWVDSRKEYEDAVGGRWEQEANLLFRPPWVGGRWDSPPLKALLVEVHFMPSRLANLRERGGGRVAKNNRLT